MTDPTSARLDLDAIRARVDGATNGPWYSERAGAIWEISDSPPDQADGYHAEAFGESDAEFITHARTDIPALLAEVKQLRQLVDAVAWCDCGIGASRDGLCDNSAIATMPHAEDCPARDRVLLAEIGPLRVLREWLATYPPLPEDVTGDPELMVVETVQHILAGGEMRFVQAAPSSPDFDSANQTAEPAKGN